MSKIEYRGSCEICRAVYESVEKIYETDEMSSRSTAPEQVQTLTQEV